MLGKDFMNSFFGAMSEMDSSIVPTEDASDMLVTGTIPGKVTDARRRGEKVTLNASDPNKFVWTFQDGSYVTYTPGKGTEHFPAPKGTDRTTTTPGTSNPHLEWCKKRAIQEMKLCGPSGAVGSMTSDVMKDDSTQHYLTKCLNGSKLLFAGKLNTKEKAIEWINSFT